MAPRRYASGRLPAYSLCRSRRRQRAASGVGLGAACHGGVAETAQTLEQQLEELGAQLAWVRDTLTQLG